MQRIFICISCFPKIRFLRASYSSKLNSMNAFSFIHLFGIAKGTRTHLNFNLARVVVLLMSLQELRHIL